MKNVFLDTNVIIDVIQKRQGYENASHILQMYLDGRVVLMTSTLSMVNISYILRKVYKGDNLYRLLGTLGDFFQIIPVSSDAYQQALLSKAGDFEDAVQLYSALEANCDCIVTRNVKDFIPDILSVFEPSEFLNLR